MAARHFLLIAVCCVIVTINAQRSVKIDAAFHYDQNNNLYLISGNRVAILRRRQERRVVNARGPLRFRPNEIDVQAAYTRFAPQRVTFYGRESGIFLKYSNPRRRKNFRYGPQRSFLRNGGPDAAGRKNNRAYFFKGCQMVIRHKWYHWGRPRDVTSIGLPCNIDAAWKLNRRAMVVLRGDQIWIWNADSSVSGPRSFSSMYTLNSWSLRPYVEPGTEGSGSGSESTSPSVEAD